MLVRVSKRDLKKLVEVSRRLDEVRKSFSKNAVRVSVDLSERLGVLGSGVLGLGVLGSGVLDSGGALLPKPPFNLKMVRL